MHLSSNSGKIELVKLLIDKGADINAQDVDGETPLNRAENEKPISDLLRKHGGKTGEELKAAGNYPNFLHHLNAFGFRLVTLSGNN